MNPHQLWVPVVFFVAVAVCVLGYFFITMRDRQDKQLTLRQALEHGQTLDKDTIALLNGGQLDRSTVLRRALSGIGLGLGFCVASMIFQTAGFDRHFWPWPLGIGAIVIGQGVGRLIAWLVSRPSKS